MSDSSRNPVGVVLEALRAQRETILSGRLGDLPGATAALEDAVAGLGAARLGERELEAIRAGAERNGMLLKESGRGVRSVIRRLRELTDPAISSRTYSSDGCSRTIGPATDGLGKRF